MQTQGGPSGGKDRFVFWSDKFGVQDQLAIDHCTIKHFEWFESNN